uniref:GPI inositol-deacylase n=1 Tax=Tetranychus urticae TaxID=32264 RepID=T1JYQ1_TETUR
MSFLLCFGFYHYAIKEEHNQCEMTFMYQFPQFIPVPLRNNISKKFPNYNLYIYGEGEYAMFLREGVIYGIPVLFVPGSAGSYKQVRSFGSIALRMAEERLMPHHFNFFTIDFSEELSGLYGAKLQSQTEFLYESIEAIKKLYLEAGRNVSLIVIGHSIGGLISRGVFTMPNFEASSVDLLITLATPHKQPALFIDTHMLNYYHNVLSYWKSNRNSSQLNHLTIISLGGGFDDKLVKSDLIQLPDLLPSSGDINLLTTAVSDVWLSTDHQCIIWCRQLIVKLAKLIFDLADSKSHKIISDPKRRTQIISYHLLNRNRGPSSNVIIPLKTKLPRKGIWISFDHRYFIFRRNKIIDATFLLFPLVPKTNVILLTSNVMRSDWVYGCNATVINVNGTSTQLCENGESLTHMSRLIQKTFGNERKVLKLDSDKLINSGHSHIVVYLGPTVTPVAVIGERYSFGRRNKAIVMPTFLDGLMSLLWTSIDILEIPVAEEAVFYNLTLVGFSQVWHSYNLKVEVRSCYQNAFEYGLIQFWVPWSYEDTSSQIAPSKSKSVTMNLRLNIPKQDPSDPRHPHLYLMLDPNCGYVVKINFSYQEVLSQLIRHYFNYFLPYISAILLSALSIQIFPQPNRNILEPLQKAGFIHSRETFEPLFVILKNNFLKISLYALLPLSPFVVDKIIRFFELSFGISLISDSVIPFSHLSLSDNQKIFLHTFLYLFSYSFTFVIASTIDLMIFFFSNIASNLIRVFNRNQLDSLEVKEKIPRLKIIPILITATFLLVTILTCSSICLIAANILFIFKLLFVSIPQHLNELRKGSNEKTTYRYIDTTLILLICSSLVPTIPTLVTWFRDQFIRNQFSKSFVDPHIISSYLIAISTSILLHSDYSPCKNKTFLKMMAYVLKLSALITPMTGLLAYNYITMFISISFILYSFFRFSLIWFYEPIKQD